MELFKIIIPIHIYYIILCIRSQQFFQIICNSSERQIFSCVSVFYLVYQVSVKTTYLSCLKGTKMSLLLTSYIKHYIIYIMLYCVLPTFLRYSCVSPKHILSRLSLIQYRICITFTSLSSPYKVGLRQKSHLLFPIRNYTT